MKKEYDEFLKSKQKRIVESGFDIQDHDINHYLFPFQKFIVKRALKAGKYAIFADCGLGKTLMQLSWANAVYKKTGKPVLILAPLAVVDQTKREAVKFEIPLYCIDADNYEQLNNIDAYAYSGVVLDESSILKNFEGATKKLIIDMFAHTPFSGLAKAGNLTTKI